MPRAAVESWRDDAAFRVRRFNGPSDLAAVLEVCLTTGEDASAQFPTHPKLLGTRWVAPWKGGGSGGVASVISFTGLVPWQSVPGVSGVGGLEVLKVA